MFSRILSKIMEVINKMFSPKTIEKVTKSVPIISSKMADAIELWSDMYTDNAPWLKEPTYADHELVASLGLAAFIASEKARMCVLELESEINCPTETVKSDNPNYVPPISDEFGNIITSGQPKTISEDIPTGPTERADFLNDCYHKKLLPKLRTQLEYGIAKGSLIIKPYPLKVTNKLVPGVLQEDLLEEEQDSFTLEFDFVQADHFYPLSFDGSGRITECAFIQPKLDKDTLYTRLEYHKLENNKLTIINKAYETKNITQSQGYAECDFGHEIPLSSVLEWSQLLPQATINNVDKLLFGYFKNPDANTVDPCSPLGISGFAKAVDLIKQADLQYSRMLWEYEAMEAAVYLDRDALKFTEDDGGHSLMTHTQQRIYRKVDTTDGNLFEAFAPALRDSSYIAGLNTLLERIEDVCALSRGTLSNVSTEAKTATELKILKQRIYCSNSETQKALEFALRDVIDAMSVYCTLYDMAGDCPNVDGKIDASKIGEYQVSFTWDDSLITDVNEELSKKIQLLNIGVISKEEIRAWYFGETPTQAKEALRKIANENEQDMEDSLMFSSFGQTPKGSTQQNSKPADNKAKDAKKE